MFRTIATRLVSPVLTAGLVFALTTCLRAQVPSTTGADLPTTSGTQAPSATGGDLPRQSGSGTGGTDTPSVRGSQGFGTGRMGPGGRSIGGPFTSGSRAPDAGPGGGSHFPDDPALVPFSVFQGAGPENASDLSSVPPALLREARTIADPSERALSLSRLAQAAIFSNELAEAHHALSEAGRAALAVKDPMLHDQRIIAVITALLNLADADLREGRADTMIPEVAEALPPDKKVDRDTLIRRAELEWRRAAHLAVRILNPTFRSEYIYRVVDGQSYGTQAIAREYPLIQASPGAKERHTAYTDMIRRILNDAASQALLIERPVWRDRALVETAVNAAGSHQYKQAVDIARLIPQPEVRTDALVRIAELQATKGDHPEEATATYEEAARAVSSIPLDDPRDVLAGVLIDNLISVGRFDDARASVVLYHDVDHKMIALGAIAYSQGRRGSAAAARQWIAREVPEEHRAVLNRKVNEGIVEAIEQNRSKALDRAR